MWSLLFGWGGRELVSERRAFIPADGFTPQKITPQVLMLSHLGGDVTPVMGLPVPTAQLCYYGEGVTKGCTGGLMLTEGFKIYRKALESIQPDSDSSDSDSDSDDSDSDSDSN